jgi:hypothetical protein
MRKRVVVAMFLAALGTAAGAEAKKTVCTITVNSSDEKEAFRKYLPRDEYQFVELVDKGRPDWLRSSCQRGIQCDVLVISGHFNAGDTFYSDKLDITEHLQVDELERASCSDSCPGLFAHLKEVYLFGCESLNADATKYQSSYGESGRERMRRLFANVPAIYGFSGPAPVGPTAGAVLGRYFNSGGAGNVATGRSNARMLQQFAYNKMIMVQGVRESDPLFAQRREVCEFYDERKDAAQKLAFIHGILRRDTAQLRAFFDRIEKLLATVDDVDRQSPAFQRAAGEISQDRATRARYLAYARGASEAALRARMLEVARTLGWLTEAEHRAETVQMVNDLLARASLSYYEVDLVCTINKDHHLDAELPRLQWAAAHAGRVTHAAALACMGSREAHLQVLRALASPDDRDVQIAQVYLRNRPLADPGELRALALGVAQMTGPAQVRALDTLGRLHISDRTILDELARSFAVAKSVNVQRAIAEVFIRSDPKAIARPELAATLREHRLRAPGGGEDLIDVLLRRLQAS